VTPVASAPARQAIATPGDGVVLLFSTPALPQSPATRFALSGRRIAAITQPMSPITVPGSARHVSGLAWWRDSVVPIIDFRGPGDHGDSAHGRRYVVAQCGARLGSTLVALPVDADITMYRPGSGDKTMPGMACPPFAAGVFDVGGEPVALLDLDALLAREAVDTGKSVRRETAAE
jgi:chemotaxis signal transduction protein